MMKVTDPTFHAAVTWTVQMKVSSDSELPYRPELNNAFIIPYQATSCNIAVVVTFKCQPTANKFDAQRHA